MKKIKRRRHRLVAMVGVELILLVVAVACVFLVSKYDMIQTPSWGTVTIQHNSEISESVITAMEEGYTDIMVFGVDARITSEGNSSLDRGTNCDVNILVHIDNATGNITLVSFYRDTYVDCDGDYRKLTDAYAKYGAAGALNAINKTFDLNVTQFVTVNWAGAAQAIDQLGGVYIDVPEAMMREINGYITETVNETGIGSLPLTGGGYQHLDGVQTVAYCRIRHISVEGYDIGDYGRTERQREVIGMLLQQAKTLNITQLNSIADTILPQIYTNLTLTDILSMATKVGNYSMSGSIGFPYNQVSLENLNYEIVSSDLYSDVLRLHQELYGTNDGYTVSSTVQTISDYTRSLY